MSQQEDLADFEQLRRSMRREEIPREIMQTERGALIMMVERARTESTNLKAQLDSALAREVKLLEILQRTTSQLVELTRRLPPTPPPPPPPPAATARVDPPRPEKPRAKKPREEWEDDISSASSSVDGEK